MFDAAGGEHRNDAARGEEHGSRTNAGIRVAQWATVRRRYEIRYDQPTGRYIVEIVDEQKQRRYMESCADWEHAESLRTQGNQRLELTGEYLPERR